MRILFQAAAIALALTSAAPVAQAHDVRVGDLTLRHPVLRLNIGDRPSAGFFTIENAGSVDDRLVAATTDAFGRVELHTHIMDDGVARMRPVDAIIAPAGDAVALEPGGLHLMLFDPTDALEAGAFVTVTLEFEQSGAVDVLFLTESIAAGAHGRGSDNGDGDAHADHGGGGHDHGASD